MTLSRVPLAYIKSASQSSYSHYSHDKDESIIPLSRDAKNREYSFHTDLEISPSWSCTFKWPITLSKLIIYNRDNPHFLHRINELSVLVQKPDGSSQLVFSQRNPTFTGRNGNNPLVIEIGNLYSTGFILQASNTTPIPLHLQQIKIFRHSPIIYFSALRQVPTKVYTCSLNQSGFGDKLLDLSTGSHILESLGYRFAGLDSSSLNRPCRLTNNSHSAIDIYKQLGLFDLASADAHVKNPYVLTLNKQVNELAFADVVQYVADDLAENASQLSYSSVQLSVSPMLCNRLLSQHRYKSFASSLNSEAIEMLKRIVNTRLRTGYSGTLNIVIHLRLGDVANLRVEENKWMIPFECAWNQNFKFLTDNQIRTHERYDRIPLISKILTNLSALPSRSKISVTLVSDGIVGTQTFINEKLSILDSSSRTNILEKALLYTQSINDKLEDMCKLTDRAIIGESSENFYQVVREIVNADAIISTNGHYCYQLSLLSAKSPFIAMAYMPRTHRDPAKHTLYWSGNDKYDVDYIANAIEAMA